MKTTIRGVYINPSYGIAEERTIPNRYDALQAMLETEHTYISHMTLKTHRGALNVRITFANQDEAEKRGDTVSCTDMNGDPLLRGILFVTTDDGEYATSLSHDEAGLVLHRVRCKVIHDDEDTRVETSLYNCTPIRMIQP